jgi:hypothetical protein
MKLILISIMALLMIASVGAVCTYTTGTRTDTLTSVLVGVDKTLTVDEYTAITGVYNITPSTSYNITVCQQSWRAKNGTNSTLNWLYVYDKKAGANKVFNITNSTGSILGQGNYTVSANAGYLRIVLSDNAFKWNGTLLNVCYTKEIKKSRDNLISNNVLKVPTGSLLSYTGGTYGFDTKVGIIDSGISYYMNNTNYIFQMSYTNKTSDCVVTTDACRSTQRTVYAAFGLIAVMAVAVAAFLIIGMFTKGDMSLGVTSIISVIFGLIGGAVILMIGYMIINVIGISIC